MKTVEHPRVVTAPRADADDLVPTDDLARTDDLAPIDDLAHTDDLARTDEWRDGEGSTKGVVAVVVERGDRTCSLYWRGSDGAWPSIDQAKNAVEKVVAQVVWRETTPGVWVARVEGSEPTPVDPGPRRARRVEDRKAVTASGRETYMAALVLRGIDRSGLSRGIA